VIAATVRSSTTLMVVMIAASECERLTSTIRHRESGAMNHVAS
jgi:hypothetical protein